MYSIVHNHFESLPSTATWAKELVDQLDVNLVTLVTADEQTAGRGQFDQQWISPPGNLYATYCFAVPLGWDQVIHAAQLLSWSAAQVLMDFDLQPTLKWPNDLLIDGKKIAGVLCETVKNGENLMVLDSIGLDINQPVETSQPTTSMTELVGHQDISAILELLNKQFLADLAVYLEEGFGPFVHPFESLLEVGDND